MKARKFWTRERLLTPPERRETTSVTEREERSDVTMMERGEAESVDVAVADLEEPEAVEALEVAVARGSLTGSLAIRGLVSRPRTREEVEGRVTGVTLRMMSR